MIAIAFVQDAFLKQSLQAIPDKKRSNLVAGQKHQLSTRIPGGDAHPVIVRIRRLHKIRLLDVGQFHSQTQSLRVFGVGCLHCGKEAIRHHLGRDRIAFDTKLVEHWHNNHSSHAMKWGIDRLKRWFASKELRIDN